MLAAQPRIGALLRALEVVNRTVAFDALGLAALFSAEPGEPAPELRRARRVVSWFGSRDAGFTARLRALVPDALVAPSSQPGRLVWQHLVATVGEPLDDVDRWRAPVPAPAGLIDEGHRALREAGWDGDTPLVVVHPGAGGLAKRWPAEGFAAVLERFTGREGITLAVHQGPADAEAVAALDARIGGRTIVVKEPALQTLAGMLGCAAAYLGNDSGVSHLAATLGVPSVVLFTADNLDWRPWARRVEPLTVRTSALDAGDCLRVASALSGLLRGLLR